MNKPWRQWEGGPCPTHPDATVRVRWKNGELSKDEHRAGNLRWSRTGFDFDVAAYQVTSVEDVE